MTANRASLFTLCHHFLDFRKRILEVENSRVGDFKLRTGEYGFLTVGSSDLFVAYGKSEFPSDKLNADFPVYSLEGSTIGNISIRYDSVISSPTDRFTFQINEKCSITLTIQTISRMTGKFSSSSRIRLPEHLIVGHRGSGMNSVTSTLLENSILSYNTAIDNGANAVETDVHMASDGVIVVNHDPHVDVFNNGQCEDSRLIREMTADEVQDSGLCTIFEERRPLFKDVLKNLKHKALIDIEIKYYDDIEHPFSDRTKIIEGVFEDIAEYGATRDIMFCSFDPMMVIMLSLTQSRYPVMKLMGQKEYHTIEDVTRIIDSLMPVFKWADVRGLEFNAIYAKKAPEWITQSVSNGFAVMTWGQKNTELWYIDLQLELGVSGFITDDVPVTKWLLKKGHNW